MSEFKSNEIRAGLMVVASAAILLIFLVAIFGINWGEENHTYRVYFQYAGGIAEGSSVKYRGFDVGTVDRIIMPTSDDTRIGAVLLIKSDIPIRRDSQAFLASIGLMTDQHIEITAGSAEEPLLADGSELTAKEVLTFAQMPETMTDWDTRLAELILQVGDLINDDNRARLSSMMAQMDSLLYDSRAPLLSTAKNLNHLTHELRQVSSRVDGFLNDNGGAIDTTLLSLKGTSAETEKLVVEMREAIGNLQLMMVANRGNLAEMTTNFQAASQNLAELSRILKEQPWLLLRKNAPQPREDE